MAGLKTDAKGNRLVTFRFGGRQFTKSACTKEQRTAEAVRARVEDTIFRLRKGYLALPPGADPGEFIVTGGQLAAKPVLTPAEPVPRALTLDSLFKLYEEHFPDGAKA